MSFLGGVAAGPAPAARADRHPSGVPAADVYFPLCKAMRSLGARVVVNQRDLMPELFAARYPNAPLAMTPVLRWLERRTQRSADHSIGVNEDLRDRMIDAGGSPDRVSIVRNGPVLSWVDRSAPDPSWRRHAHLVCWIGKMGRQDRVDLVVRMAEYVVRDLGRDDIGSCCSSHLTK
jgi:hypothetical protein